MDDISVIKRCLEGEAEVFEVLVKRYHTQVLAVSLNFQKNLEDARDMVQETFLQAYANLNRFDTTRRFKPWLLAIAVKRNLDRIKKNRTILNYFLKKSQEMKQDIATRKKDLHESDLFYPLLQSLSSRERLALILKMEEGYSAREIGEILSCSEATARVHVFNAKRKIKRTLDKMGNPTETKKE